ncbi:MAG: hypothetical protein K9I29_06475 [Bacteroidales bacterium]|nr:hypothetical protein [Bacteroidales bacterium]MCF8327924.1 hypothetical protein [Bacteroidales bacterium]
MRKTALSFASILMLVFGLLLIYFGIFQGGGDIVWPPIISGAGFIVVSWIFQILRKFPYSDSGS